MATEYEIRVRDENGDMAGRIGIGLPNEDGSIIRPFHYVKDLQTPGMLYFRMDGNNDIIQYMNKNAQVEVWRNVDNNGWYRDFLGIVLDDYDYVQDDELKYDIYIPGHKVILDWAIVAWKSATNNRSSFSGVPAETIMKTLVDYNLASNATEANGRELDFQCPFTITVEADAGGGNSKDWNCAFDRVLQTLHDLSLVGGGDYDLIRDPDGDGSNQKFEFRFYAGQRGSDLTSTIILGISRGNLKNYKYSNRGSQVKTKVVVGGQGQGSDRDVVVRTSSDYSASFHRELFVNGNNYASGDTSGLEDFGDKWLEEYSEKEELDFEVLDAENAKYGVNYGINASGDRGILGDLVSVIRAHDNVSETHKIEGAVVSRNAQGEEGLTIKTRKV